MAREVRVSAKKADQLLEIEKKKLEIARAEIDNRIAEADAERAEYEATLAGYEVNRQNMAGALSLTSDERHEYLFKARVEEESVTEILERLAYWHRDDPACPMNITLDTGGGYIDDGMHLFDQLVAYSERGGGEHRLTITVRGMAASMGSILLQAADERVMGPQATLMIHEASTGFFGRVSEMRDYYAFMDQLEERIIRLFVDRSNITYEQFRGTYDLRRDWWLAADEAFDLGFIDRIG